MEFESLNKEFTKEEDIKELEGLIFDAKYYAKEWEDKLYKYQNELEKLKEELKKNGGNKMKTTLILGKIDYNGTGRKINQVEIEIRLKDTDKGKVFSAVGSIWNSQHTDWICGGQNIDKIYEFFKNDKKVETIYNIWKKYHLNDFHPGCEHQRALGWEEDGYEKHPSEPCPVCGYKFGSFWNFEEIPNDIIKEIENIIKENNGE